ncbi:carbon-nitrogen hydrolase family protein [Kineococcus sp. SYSU DK005]|uniref:carbon-nitrogen hydrolase family protein n=1 Tax=Kineococcus sp. SYSU DK005 TaxID=3383126 RepID=UPI003D7C7CDA
MLIALAQSAAVDGDVPANVEQHVRAVSAAAAAGARLVLFPELSLTGYVPGDIARDGALTLEVDDPRLLGLRQQCRQRSITAVLGAPTTRAGRRRLSALVLDEGGGVSVYDKRTLFEHEITVFSPGRDARVLEVDGRRLALGVCADLGSDVQAAEAGGADAWLLGVLLSPGGYGADAERAAQVARRHGVPVVLANHAGPTGGWVGAGGSGVWCSTGEAVTADARPGVWLVDLDEPSALRRLD